MPTPKTLPKKLTEEYANGLPFKEIYNNNRADRYEYVQIKTYDADAVFDIVSQGLPVLIGFYSSREEWDFEMRPWDTVSFWTAPVRHFVVALPNSNHWHNNQEWVSIIDSAPNKGHTLRHVSYSFLRQRMGIGAGYYQPVSTKKEKVTILPTIKCEFRMNGDAVFRLQKFLTQIGLMAEQHNTGYYGNITSAAVLQWQLANLPESDHFELMEYEGRWWGPASISKVKELYPNV